MHAHMGYVVSAGNSAFGKVWEEKEGRAADVGSGKTRQMKKEMPIAIVSVSSMLLLLKPIDSKRKFTISKHQNRFSSISEQRFQEYLYSKYSSVRLPTYLSITKQNSEIMHAHTSHIMLLHSMRFVVLIHHKREIMRQVQDDGRVDVKYGMRSTANGNGNGDTHTHTNCRKTRRCWKRETTQKHIWWTWIIHKQFFFSPSFCRFFLLHTRNRSSTYVFRIHVFGAWSLRSVGAQRWETEIYVRILRLWLRRASTISV